MTPPTTPELLLMLVLLLCIGLLVVALIRKSKEQTASVHYTAAYKSRLEEAIKELRQAKLLVTKRTNEVAEQQEFINTVQYRSRLENGYIPVRKLRNGAKQCTNCAKFVANNKICQLPNYP